MAVADDTLTDAEWSVDYGRPYVIEIGGRQWQWLNMRSEGGIERAVREHNRAVRELASARTRLAAVEAENEKLRSDVATAETRGRQEFAAYLMRLSDATRAALGVDGD